MKRFFLVCFALIAAGILTYDGVRADTEAQTGDQTETGDETQYTWSHVDLDGGAAANYAACENCDDLSLALYCAKGQDRLLIDVYMDVIKGEDLDAADIAFRIDEREDIVREGYLELNLMDDILQPVIETAVDDPLLAAMTGGEKLTISVRDQDKDFMLEGADEAIRGMLALCGIEPPPAMEKDPAEDEQSADPEEENSG